MPSIGFVGVHPGSVAGAGPMITHWQSVALNTTAAAPFATGSSSVVDGSRYRSPRYPRCSYRIEWWAGLALLSLMSSRILRNEWSRWMVRAGASRARSASATSRPIAVRIGRMLLTARRPESSQNSPPLLDRVARLPPRLDAAVERDRPRVAHRPQRLRSERRDLPELAARDDARGRIGQRLIDAELELPPRQVPRAGDVARVVGVLLAHVEDDESRVVSRHPVPDLLHRHERDPPGRLGEQLGNRLPAGPVGPERLGQVVRHSEAEGPHLLDEALALALLQARVLGLLLSEGRDGRALVVVARIHGELVRELEQPAEQALVQGAGIPGREIRAPRREAEEGVAGQHTVGQDERHRVVGVTRGVENTEAELARDERLAVVDAHVHVGRDARAVHDGRYAEPSPELARRREVVGVRVGVDQVVETDAGLPDQAEEPVDLRQLRVDDHAAARLRAADEIAAAAASADLLEQHGQPRW